MQDASTAEFVAAAFDPPKMQQPVTLAGAAAEAAGVPANRMSDPDKNAVVTADRTCAGQTAGAELAAIVKPGAKEPAQPGPASDIRGHGFMLRCGMRRS